jgi:nicotinate (nicotinamide) nucleotide adenylyltransferase
MKIGLFFGSFNPIHNGHLAIANYMVEHSGIDRLWFVVSPQNPLKNRIGLLNDQLRLEMVKLAIAGNERIEACDVEFGLPKPSYTIDTLGWLQHKYPEDEFFLIMGADNFVNLTKWKNYGTLISNYPFLIYPRPGIDLQSTDLEGYFTIINAPLMDISSTEIRNLIAENSDFREYLPQTVFQFIKERSLYSGFSLSKVEKIQLLKIARDSIEYWLLHKRFMPLGGMIFSDRLKTPCGAFVTLHKESRLRGCIGRFGETEPLFKIVQEMAVSAAFNDNRFNPVVKEEMESIDIEISVLTPLKRIFSIDDFELGKQGIYIKTDFRSGTFLPQVAHDTNWSKEEFMGHCARDKAGIGWDGWKTADLFTYEALLFGEKEM